MTLATTFAVASCAPTLSDQVRQLNQQGLVHLQQRQFADAQSAFHKASQLDPEDTSILYNLANAAHQAGDLKRAEQGYRDVLAKQEAHPAARHSLAVLLYEGNRGDEASQMVISFAEAHPDSATAQAEYGWLLRERGEFPTAQAHLQRALEIDPGNVRALIELGRLYEAYQYPDRAKSLYERVLAKSPDNPEVVARLTSLRGKPTRP
jgi:tetratricopeptide (TPR) repeat protein